MEEDRAAAVCAPQQWQGGVKVVPTSALMVIKHTQIFTYMYIYLSCEVWSPLAHAMAAAVRSSADAAAAGLPHRLALQRCGYGGGCEGLHQQ